MKKVVVLIWFISSFSTSLVAQTFFTKEFDVNFRETKNYSEKGQVVYKKPKALVKRKVILENLISENSFDGEYFKIVESDSNDAISFNHSDKKLLFKAATTYYYLSKTRERFLEIFPHFAGGKQKTVVRIEMSKRFSPRTHFDERTHIFNDARTVPASLFQQQKEIDPCRLFKQEDCSIQTILPWNEEIWFYRPRLEKDESTYEQVATQINSREMKNILLGNFIYADLSQALYEISNGGVVDDLFFEYHLVSLGLSLGVSEIIPQILELSSKIFKNRTYLDTALIPEVISHEYMHILLKNFLPLDNSNHINEGFANFFTYRVNLIPSIGKKSRKYHKGLLSKQLHSKEKYRLSLETVPDLAHGSFVFSLLGDLQEALGEYADAVFLSSLRYLDGASFLNKGLVMAINKGIDDVSKGRPELNFSLKNKCLAVFLKRGL